MGKNMSHKLCRRSLSWLDPPNKKANQDYSETGASAEKTCHNLAHLIERNDNAAKVYSKHSQDLKLSTTAKLTSVSLYSTEVSIRVLKPKSNTDRKLGLTTIAVEKTVRVAYRNKKSTQVFTVLSHSVRACGRI